MFSQTQKTNPFFPLALISICLVGAMSTWFSGTVIRLELTLRSELGASQQVWLTNSVQVGFVVGALLIAFFNIADTAPLPILIGLSCALASITNLLFSARARFDPRQIMLIIRNKPLTLVNIGYAGHMWELYAMWAWILVFAQFSQQNFVNFPFGTPEYFCFFVVAVGAIGCIAGGLLSDIFGRCYTTAILMIISGTCAFLIGFLVHISLGQHLQRKWLLVLGLQ